MESSQAEFHRLQERIQHFAGILYVTHIVLFWAFFAAGLCLTVFGFTVPRNTEYLYRALLTVGVCLLFVFSIAFIILLRKTEAAASEIRGITPKDELA